MTKLEKWQKQLGGGREEHLILCEEHLAELVATKSLSHLVMEICPNCLYTRPVTLRFMAKEKIKKYKILEWR